MAIPAKFRKLNISFVPSPSPDVVGYKMYYDQGDTITEDSPAIDIGNRTSIVVPDDSPNLEFDGVYTIAFEAYDEEGNSSGTGPEVVTPLDFMPPAPPGAVTISEM